MNVHEYKKALDKSMGLQLIVAGLSMLVEDEGHTTREAFKLLEDTKRNTFQALSEISRGESNESRT